jgi:uncharacterized membrane protein
MGKTRLEAFSDGVIAIIITIMVLELKVPHGDRSSRSAAAPVFLSYVLSFIYVGIYWTTTTTCCTPACGISGGVLLGQSSSAVLVSLMPFATGWMGENTSPRCRLRYTASCCSWRPSRT